MAWKGSSQVEKGTGRLPCLTWVKRSSSAAATTTPSCTRQAAGSWKAALIPRVYMRISGGSASAAESGPHVRGRPGRDLVEQLADGPDDGVRGDFAQAVVVPLGADALVAVLAIHVVGEAPAGHQPRRGLRVG